MKNIDKYAQEILKQLGETGDWAIKDGKICSCGGSGCGLCAFNIWSVDVDDCSTAKTNWLNTDEDEKMKHFSQADKEVLRALTKVQWVARDKNGDVFGYCVKPIKSDGEWRSFKGRFVNLTPFTTAEFTPIKWEDNEPTSREEILRD